MRRVVLAALFVLTVAVPTWAATVTATWNANPEPDIASYLLSYGVKSGVYTTTISTGNVVTSVVMSLNAGTTYYFTLQAVNTAGLVSPRSAEVSATIPAAPVNKAPIVTGGANQTITLPATATLTGTVADDGLPTGAKVTSTWSKVSGTGTVTFTDATKPATTAAFSAADTYVLKLTATDTALSASANTTVTVNPVPVDPCSVPLGATAVQIFPTKLSTTGSGGAGSKARIDFQVGSPNSPVTRTGIKANGTEIASMTGTDLSNLAGMWFTVPTASATYKFSVTAVNAAGCTREQSTTYQIVVP